MTCRFGLRNISKVPRLLTRRMSTESSNEVNFKVSGKVGMITLNKPKALNAINLNMVKLITDNMVQWRSDDNVEVVCIEGSGGKAFCAGGDVVSITKDVPLDVTVDFFRTEFQMNHLIGTYPKPYVALIHGIVMGGGVGLSVHGDYRVATDKSLYAMPETAIGYFPDVGGSYFLSRLPWPFGMFLGLTGQRLKGPDLKHLKIATHYTHSDNLPALKEAIAQSSADSIKSVLEQHETPIDIEFSFEPHRPSIEKCFCGSSIDDIISMLKAENTDFTNKIVSSLYKMSPRSLKVTHELLTRARDLSYEECFRMELNAANEIVRSGEFTEGVRALLVDKDNCPNWKPDSLDEVNHDIVKKYFDKENTKPWQPLEL